MMVGGGGRVRNERIMELRVARCRLRPDLHYNNHDKISRQLELISIAITSKIV